MDKPELFNKNNLITRAGTIQCLDEYAPKFKWNKDGESIIDLGCGDGHVTCILKNYVPNNYKKFVACDINENMVDFTREHYGNENITFIIQDVEGELPDDLKAAFNHVFSFYLFQWIRNQEKGFKTVYDLLTNEGECLVTCLGYKPVYHVIDILGRTEKWKSTWIKDVDGFLSPYYNMPDIEINLTKMLDTIGFSDINVECKKMTHVYDTLEDLKNMLYAVQPFQMPPDVYEEFFRDFVCVGKEIGFIDKSINHEKDEIPVKCDYILVVVHARKP